MITLSAASAHAIPLPDGAVHCVVTSPPYYSLRSYGSKEEKELGALEIEWPCVSYAPMPGLEPVEIAGCGPGCEHEWGDGPIVRVGRNDESPEELQRRYEKYGTGRVKATQTPNVTTARQGAYCQRCGGWRGALGLEPTPEVYIAHLVLCFREIRRVLRDDGVAWCVVGDSFAAQQGQRKTTDKAGPKQQTNRGAPGAPSRHSDNLHPGDLMLIPHRLALALQADGWTCRNDVVWAKKAPMPESVAGWRWERCKVKVAPCPTTGRDTGGAGWGKRVPGGANQSSRVDHAVTATWSDCPGCPKCSPNGGYVLRRGSWRHTRAHEVVLMLTTRMGYFCDQEKVREAHANPEWVKRALSGAWTRNQDCKTYNDGGHFRHGSKPANKAGASYGRSINPAGRNPRSVLTPRPESFSGAHYAVFPSTLIAPLIRASCPARCCPECSAAWAPVVERSAPIDRPDNPNPATPYTANSGHTNATGATTLHKIVPSSVLGYRPTCECGQVNKRVVCPSCAGGSVQWTITCPVCQNTGKIIRISAGDQLDNGQASGNGCERGMAGRSAHSNHVPGTVLDPFVGSGTVLAVARELGLNAIGLDLSPSYLDEHARPRIGLTPSKALEELPLFQEELWRTSPHWRPRPSFLEE